jgi:hypothetical protein
MPVEKEAFTQKVEEFKETGHEIRYREQLMVQEFSLSMIAAGITIGALVPRLGSLAGLVIQALGAAFLLLLTVHLRNINQDRVVALARREELRNELGFGLINQNIRGDKRASAPRLMVRFAGTVAAVWMFWVATNIWTLSPTLRCAAPG